ncbi:hypothetical protein PENTCL1PPCAC_15079, partial [Pristionchus entomophagus]
PIRLSHSLRMKEQNARVESATPRRPVTLLLVPWREVLRHRKQNGVVGPLEGIEKRRDIIEHDYVSVQEKYLFHVSWEYFRNGQS